MNDLMLSSLKTYWDRLRAGRVAPYRAEIDPRQFEPALENMFIIEKLAPDNMRIRLAGMKICEMMGMEVRGMQPGFLIDEADRTRFDRLLNVVMTEPAVVELKLAAPNRAGTYRATMLMMPLRSDFGDINRVIGCTSGEGDLFAPPLDLLHRGRGGDAGRAQPGRRGAAGDARLRRGPGRLRPAAALRPAGAEAPLHRGQPQRAGKAARGRRRAAVPGHRREVAVVGPCRAG